jgi:hypothetical protein
MSHSVTTPGGFFIGLGGIALSLVVVGAVYSLVKSPELGDELKPQQISLGLAPAADATGDPVAAKNEEVSKLLTAAGAKYNGGAKPNINKLDDLRGVVRYREAQKSIADAEKVLGALSSVKAADGKPLSVLAAAMQDVEKSIAAKKPAPSAVKVDIAPPAEPTMPPPMPNVQSGGANTVIFSAPAEKKAEVPKSAEPEKPAAAPEPKKSAALGATISGFASNSSTIGLNR